MTERASAYRPPGPPAAGQEWVGWEKTDGWPSLAALARRSPDAGVLESALSYRLTSCFDERRRTWGSAFIPLTIGDGRVWPTPLPTLTDMEAVAWARLLRRHLPPPVEARLRDLQLHHGRGRGGDASLDHVIDTYVSTWESGWAEPPRIYSLARAVELSSRSPGERAAQVRKCAFEAWDQFCDGTVIRPPTSLQMAWVALIEATAAVALLDRDDTAPRAFLRRRPESALLVNDAWCKLGQLISAGEPRSDHFRTMRRGVWRQLAKLAQAGDLDAQSDLAEMTTADPAFAVVVMVST